MLDTSYHYQSSTITRAIDVKHTFAILILPMSPSEHTDLATSLYNCFSDSLIDLVHRHGKCRSTWIAVIWSQTALW